MRKQHPDPTRQEYLNKDFDYTILTKNQIARILSECNCPVPNIPTTKKSEFIEIYKKEIFDKIEELKSKYLNVKPDGRDIQRVGSDREEYSGVKRDKKDMQRVGNESVFSEDNPFQSETDISRTPNRSKLGNNFVKLSVSTEKGHKGRRVSSESSDMSISEDSDSTSPLVKKRRQSIKNKTPLRNKTDKRESLSKSPLKYKRESLKRSIDRGVNDYPYDNTPLGTSRANRSMDRGVNDYSYDNTPLGTSRASRSMDRGVNTHPYDNTPYNTTPTKYNSPLNKSIDNTPYNTNTPTPNPYVTTPLRTTKSLHSINQHTHPIFFRHPHVRRSKRNIFLFFLLFILLTCYSYLKYFCPYCTDCKQKNFIKNFCIPKPHNSSFINDEFVCDKGYIYKKNYFYRNVCVKDVSRYNKIRKKVDFIVEELQISNWKYKHGIIDTNRVSIEEIENKVNGYSRVADKSNKSKGKSNDNSNDNSKGKSDDNSNDNSKDKSTTTTNNNTTNTTTNNTTNTSITNNNTTTSNTNDCDIPLKDILDELGVRKGVLREDNYFYTFDIKIPVSLFLKFYILKILKILIIPISTIFLIYLISKYEIKKRKKIKKNKEMADLLVKDILEALSLQVLHNSKDKSVISCIALTQLKDYFGIEEDVWVEVVGRIRRNSNVRENMSVIKGEEMRVWEWIGPIIGVHGKRMSE